MDSFEKEALANGYRFVAGLDEAGRGPLAGPVVAAAVIFTCLPENSQINDSKKLTPKKREALVFEIYRRAFSVGVGIVWPEEIDLINIHKASLKAMEKAVSSLSVAPDLLLIDGSFPTGLRTPQRPIVSGDSLSISIAAASIIAKTARDNLMAAYHALYPGYNFASHKGYPTREHLLALQKLGPTPIHRMTFRGVVAGPL